MIRPTHGSCSSSLDMQVSYRAMLPPSLMMLFFSWIRLFIQNLFPPSHKVVFEICASLSDSAPSINLHLYYLLSSENFLAPSSFGGHKLLHFKTCWKPEYCLFASNGLKHRKELRNYSFINLCHRLSFDWQDWQSIKSALGKASKKSIFFLGNSPKQLTPPTHPYGLGLT